MTGRHINNKPLASTICHPFKRFSHSRMVFPAYKRRPHLPRKVHEFGLNYRLPDVLCALGISQLTRLEESKSKKLDIFHEYSSEFGNHENLILPTTRPDIVPNWHLYPLRVPMNQRRQIIEEMTAHGIRAQVNYIPAYWHPVFQDRAFKKDQYLNSYNFYQSEISIPMFSSLTINEVGFVINTVVEIINRIV